MPHCEVCRDTTCSSYLFTQCSHLLCLRCAASIWDKRYSLRCCNRTTFLEEETCQQLSQLSEPDRQQVKESKQIKEVRQIREVREQKREEKENIPLSIPIHRQKNREFQPESIYISEQQTNPVLNEENKKGDHVLSQMESIMSESVSKVKFTFEMYRKELEKKEQILLKDLYNQYSHHLNCLSNSVSEDDAKLLKDQLTKIINEQIAKISLKDEPKQDKILEKLEYNQIKMKQKLSRHYQLLK